MYYLDLLGLWAFFALIFPLLTGWIADSYGRSFWRWFLLGLLLPFVSMFVILAVCIRDQLREEKRAAKSPNL